MAELPVGTQQWFRETREGYFKCSMEEFVCNQKDDLDAYLKNLESIQQVLEKHPYITGSEGKMSRWQFTSCNSCIIYIVGYADVLLVSNSSLSSYFRTNYSRVESLLSQRLSQSGGNVCKSLQESGLQMTSEINMESNSVWRISLCVPPAS